MKKAILLLGLIMPLFETSVYTFQITTVSGSTISLSQYQGKKILIVNVASGSNRANQFDELEQFYQLHKDSLVVIGFPSNSFSNEPLSNSELSSYAQANGITFPIAAKGNVAGPERQPFYQWITKKSENGMLGSRVEGDFQKYLINKQGKLVAMFDTATNVLDPIVAEALRVGDN